MTCNATATRWLFRCRNTDTSASASASGRRRRRRSTCRCLTSLCQQSNYHWPWTGYNLCELFSFLLTLKMQSVTKWICSWSDLLLSVQVSACHERLDEWTSCGFCIVSLAECNLLSKLKGSFHMQRHCACFSLSLCLFTLLFTLLLVLPRAEQAQCNGHTKTDSLNSSLRVI